MKTWSNFVRAQYEVIRYFSLLLFLLIFPFQTVNVRMFVSNRDTPAA